MSPLLRRLRVDQVPARRTLDFAAGDRGAAEDIVSDVRIRGDSALREHAQRLGDLRPGDELVLGREALEGALLGLEPEQRELLERTAERITRFAHAQRASLVEFDTPIPGGRAGQCITPVASAGCYAPGGRFPLPSSVLMTACTARVAGVQRVVVASPRPGPLTLAAAAVAGADQFLCVGGAQAIAALAYGVDALEGVDFVCGPGNRWVTLAKRAVFGDVGVDMLAGPSELVVLADGEAAPELVAADLLAQAEHDVDALPILIALDADWLERLETCLQRRLADLGQGCAQTSLRAGFAVLVERSEQVPDVVRRIAPEHLQLVVADPEPWVTRLSDCGAVFVGARSGEVLGDYGAGPNHVLPTSGSARHRGGLSVLDFLRVRTWMRMDDARATCEVARDATSLARLEGLEAHARAAELRTTLS